MVCSAPLPTLTRTPVIVGCGCRPRSGPAPRNSRSRAHSAAPAAAAAHGLPAPGARPAARPDRSAPTSCVTPWPIQLTSPAISPRTPPQATTSSVQPGKKSSITVRPRASRPCAWRPCGTPLRGTSDERETVALQHRDDGIEIRQRPRGQQAAHARADHNGMLANLFHGDAPALNVSSPASRRVPAGTGQKPDRFWPRRLTNLSEAA